MSCIRANMTRVGEGITTFAKRVGGIFARVSRVKEELFARAERRVGVDISMSRFRWNGSVSYGRVGGLSVRTAIVCATGLGGGFIALYVDEGPLFTIDGNYLIVQ